MARKTPRDWANASGNPTGARPPGRLVWLHGASLGESLSLLPLIERFIQRGLEVLVTSGTVSSARVLTARLPAGAFHQYAPLDAPQFVDRFLDHWRPDIAVFAESELWPNMVARGARARRAAHPRQRPHLAKIGRALAQRARRGRNPFSARWTFVSRRTPTTRRAFSGLARAACALRAI